MAPQPRNRGPWTQVRAVFALLSVLLAGSVAGQSPPSHEAGSVAPEAIPPGASTATRVEASDAEAGGSDDTPEDDAAADEEEAPRHVGLRDSITVTATRSALPLGEAPGHVDVIDAREIEERLVADAADLVRYQPGVYADSDPTRLGVGGFNIRGIGGNRVLTRIDGVPTGDGFDFSPLVIPRYTLDPEILQRVEIVRSAVSTLYGSDALGGVVSLQTRDPLDFLLLGDGGNTFLGLKAGWDGRRDESDTGLTVAGGNDLWQAYVWGSYRDGGERDNQGDVDVEGALRTVPNPIDRTSTNLLAKTTYTGSESVLWKLSAELFDAAAETEAFSERGVQNLGPQFGPGVTYRISTVDFDADDQQKRWRLSLERTAQSAGPLYDQIVWRLYGQQDETEQTTLERRETTIGGGPFGPLSTTALVRDGLFSFEQEAVGGEIQLQKSWGGRVDHRLTYGAAAARDELDTLRDRTDVDPETGGEIPSSTPHPTKYFPATTTEEIGLFVQDEIALANGRLLVVPGLRWDRFSLDPDADDPIFFAGNPGTEAPVGLDESALSPRLGLVYRLTEPLVAFAQYARGFRAPGYAEVNNGFSNFAFGYRTLPNPDLEPETSDNLEVGLRWTTPRVSLDVTGFDNDYQDFIETAVAAVDPQTGFIDFQYQNVASARIRGVELSGDVRLGRSWQLRGAYAWIEGDDEENDAPLNSIAPPQLVAGLAFRHRSGAWGAELAATVVEAKDDDRVDRGAFQQFATPGYELLDLTAFYELPGGFSLQGGLFNLLDETYWTWTDARGLTAGSPVLDRYSSPGLNAAVALRYRR